MIRAYSATAISALLLIATAAFGQTVHRSPEIPKFMGREVVLYEPAKDDGSGDPPKEPAKLCLEGPPKEQCYATPEGYGFEPTVQIVELSKEKSALFFSAWSGGVSGRSARLALLTLGPRMTLDNLFVEDSSVSNQSQTAFWSELDLSESRIFVVADFLWGPDEGHYGPHRYKISAYIFKGFLYRLIDEYVTSKWYD